MLTKLELKIAEIGFVFMLLFGAYFWVGHNAVENYKEDQVVKQAVVDKAQQAKYDKLSQNYEELRNKREDHARVITKEVEKVVTRDIYRNICIDDDGLRIINEAISGKHSSQPDTKMPSDPAR